MEAWPRSQGVPAVKRHTNQLELLQLPGGVEGGVVFCTGYNMQNAKPFYVIGLAFGAIDIGARLTVYSGDLVAAVWQCCLPLVLLRSPLTRTTYLALAYWHFAQHDAMTPRLEWGPEILFTTRGRYDTPLAVYKSTMRMTIGHSISLYRASSRPPTSTLPNIVQL